MTKYKEFKNLRPENGGGGYNLLDKLQEEQRSNKLLFCAGDSMMPAMTEQGMISSNGNPYNSAGVLTTWSRSPFIPYTTPNLDFLAKIIFTSNTSYLSVAFYRIDYSFISGLTAAQTATEVSATPPVGTKYYRICTQNANLATSVFKIKTDVEQSLLVNNEDTVYMLSKDVMLRSIVGGKKIEIPANYDLLKLVSYWEAGLIKATDGSDYNSVGVDTAYSRTNFIKTFENMKMLVNIVNNQSQYVAIAFYTKDYVHIPALNVLGNAGATEVNCLSAYYFRASVLNSSKYTSYLTCNEAYTAYPSIRAVIQDENEALDVYTPPYIYTTCNDISVTTSKSYGYLQRNYSATLFLDRLFKFESTKIPSSLYFDATKSDKLPIYAPISGYNGTFNSATLTANPSEPKTTTSVAVKTKGRYAINETISQRSSSSTNGKTVLTKLLSIGDSITNKSGSDYNAVAGDATVYWSWVERLFNLDKIESGNGVADYNMITIGAKSVHDFAFSYNGITKNIHSCGEGRSGWKITDYYENEWYNDTVGHYAGYNYFYDNVTYASEACKFSLSAYIENYRTLDDNGNRLLITDPAIGTRVVSHTAYLALSANDKMIYIDYDANWNVCTPTHIVLSLGTNDTDTAANSAAKLLEIINRVKAEGFSCKFSVQQVGFSGTYFPEKYPQYSTANILLDYTAAVKCDLYNQAYAELNNDVDIFYLPSYYVQPTAESTTTRNIDHLDSLVDGTNKKLGVEFGNEPNYHPNVRAHLAWAYQIYSWIKWTIV